MNRSAEILQSIIEKKEQHIYRSGFASLAKLMAEAVSENKYTVAVVKNRDELATLKSFLSLFIAKISVGKEKGSVQEKNIPLFFETPFVSINPFNRRSLNREGWADRLSALYAMGQGTAKALIMTADMLIPYLPEKEFFDRHELFLKVHDDMAPELLMEQLVDWGYQRESMVSRAGDVARRGDIVDIFPAGYEKPIRLDFFGDTIDEMRFFDPSTQRSVGVTQEICILPVLAALQDENARAKIRKRLANLFQQGRLSELRQASIMRAVEQGDMRLLPGNIYEHATNIEDWLPENCQWFLPSKADLKECLEEAESNWQDALEEDRLDAGFDQADYLSLRNTGDIFSMLAKQNHCYIEPLRIGIETQGLDLSEKIFFNFEELFQGKEVFERPWQQLVAGTAKLCQRKRADYFNLFLRTGTAKVFKID